MPLFERRHFAVTEYTLSFPSLPEAFDGFRAVFLSDLHGIRFGKGNATLVDAILKPGCDLLLIGGDMMTVKPDRICDFSALEEILAGVQNRMPVFYGEGNHETRMRERAERYPGWYASFQTLLRRYGVHFLKDEAGEVHRDGDFIRIAGIGLTEKEYLRGTKRRIDPMFLENKLKKEDGFTILLLHSPAYFEEAADWGADLVLSGHFHGGTVYLGKLGGLMTPQFCFFEKRVRGVFDVNGTRGVVSAGLGTHSVNLRVNNPPEVVRLLLKKEKKTGENQESKHGTSGI